VPEPALSLRAGRERSLRRRHPWVFSGSVESVAGDPAHGDTVLVLSAGGEALGRGAYSPASQIRARMWTFEPDAVVDEAWICARVAASSRRRADLSARTDAARLVFAESDGLPGVVADRYGPWVVVELTSAGADRWREPVADALAALPGVEGVFERSGQEVRRLERLPPRRGVLRGAAPPGLVQIEEDGATYLVDVAGGHKTGFYLDQRESRRFVRDVAAGRRLLDVCTYTGGFAVAAARGGAATITAIDSSHAALELAARNLRANDVADADLLEVDAFAGLRDLVREGARYDLIVLDPPKLAQRAEHVVRATRAYKDLNLHALRLLAPDGVLVTFSCSGHVDARLFQKVVAGAALDAGREVQVVARLTQATDHPVLMSFPEGEYLTGLALRIVT
jgi:23S rRNA (cytosine1962-C5)-methyltransferase